MGCKFIGPHRLNHQHFVLRQAHRTIVRIKEITGSNTQMLRYKAQMRKSFTAIAQFHFGNIGRIYPRAMTKLGKR